MYASKQDMMTRFGEREMIQLTDRAVPPTGEIDDAVLALALADAGALIDSYVSRRYDLPLATTPVVVRGLCMTIARYTLHRGRHPEEVRKDYEDALDYLKQVSTGVAVLDVGGSEPKSAPAQVVVDSAGRTFSRKKRWF